MDKILVIQTAFIGDAVLTLPMIQKLKELNPLSIIDVVSTPVSKEIFEASECVNKVFPLDKRNEHKSLKAVYSFGRKISKEGYTKLYSPHRSFRSSLIALFSNVRETYGFSNSSFKIVYKHLVEYDVKDHEVKRNLAMTGCNTSGDAWKILPQIKATEKQADRVKSFIEKHELKRFAVLAPESVWQTKMYPADYFKIIAEYFIKNKYKVMLTGGTKDREKLKENFGSNFNVIIAAGEFSIVESIELLRHANILVSNDSAPTHFGVCADIPVLTLYCSTTPEIGFYPYNRKSKYLSINGLKCKPCGIHGKNECPLGTFECGKKLNPELVIKTIEEMTNDEHEQKDAS
jgi:heptosyltransferase II